MELKFRLNGEKVCVDVPESYRALDVMREACGMLSVKEGCSEGECGACTIILNRKAVTSCTMLAGQLAGGDVITLEGLAKDGILDPLQQAFMDEGAVQCGYCTPGMILAAKALLMSSPNPSRDEIRRSISGNLCRCTGYAKIVAAIERAAAGTAAVRARAAAKSAAGEA